LDTVAFVVAGPCAEDMEVGVSERRDCPAPLVLSTAVDDELDGVFDMNAARGAEKPPWA